MSTSHVFRPVDTGPGPAGSTLLSKVPEITVLFWVVKVLTTGMGESASDWLLNRGEGQPGLGVPGALIIDAGLFVAAFVLQFAVPRYIPAVYWLAVAAVGVVGTLAADITHFIVGVPLWATVTLYAAVLAVNFALWYRLEGTLSIHSIHTRRREVFYWVAVFFTFAMGTAVGDLTALAWHLGFLGSILLFAVLIAIPALAHRLGANAVVTFWCAYVLTRPLGASIADWLAVTPAEGGLSLGTGPVTLGAIALIAVLVGYLSLLQRHRPTSA